MSNSEEMSGKAEEKTSTSDSKPTSITDCFSMGPIAAASRLMSSFSRHARHSVPHGELDEKDKTSTRNSLTARNRSTSPSSAPSTTNSSPFFRKFSSSTLPNSSTTPSSLNYSSQSPTITSDTLSTPTPETVDLNFNFDAAYKQLRELAEINRSYFSRQNSDVCQRFDRLLVLLLHALELSVPLIRHLTKNFQYYDYSPEIRANGYRTLVVSHGQICLRTLDILRQVDTKRVGVLFNLMYSSRLFQDLESWTKALTGMQHLLSFAAKIAGYSEKKDLHVDADRIPLDIELDYFKIVAFESEHFFGRTCGFQFAQSMQTMLTYLLAGFATYHETYNRSIPFAAASLATAPKYILFPEQRAKKCAAIFRDSDYLFCKSFWNLVDHDFIKMGSRYIAPNVTVSKYFQIGPEPLEIGTIVIQPPTARAGLDEPEERTAGNIGPGSDNITGSGSQNPKQLVNLKLLSNEIREGMSDLPLRKGDLETSSSKVSPMSDQLLMHVHGGGFIATSSTTHEVYLKPWALGLEIPIVSVDYSLAPEYPFPRAIEECFYAYAWILKNASKLGWTGKTILLVGDSAGGNLITIVTMKAIEIGLRKPDAIICFYTPFLLGYSLSPSRLMAIMDPLLNTGFLWRCLAAYAGIQSDNEPPLDELSSVSISTTAPDSVTTDLSSKNQRQLDTAHSTSDQTTFESPEHMREDTYYARLTDIVGSRQAYLLRKLRESTLPNHPHMSPIKASDEILRQFPMTYLIPCARDPFLDDNVDLARRLRSLGVPHQLKVVDEWPHGYLDFGFASNEIAQYNVEIITMLQNILRKSYPGDVASEPTSIE